MNLREEIALSVRKISNLGTIPIAVWGTGEASQKTISILKEIGLCPNIYLNAFPSNCQKIETLTWICSIALYRND